MADIDPEAPENQVANFTELLSRLSIGSTVLKISSRGKAAKVRKDVFLLRLREECVVCGGGRGDSAAAPRARRRRAAVKQQTPALTLLCERHRI